MVSPAAWTVPFLSLVIIVYCARVIFRSRGFVAESEDSATTTQRRVRRRTHPTNLLQQQHLLRLGVRIGFETIEVHNTGDTTTIPLDRMHTRILDAIANGRDRLPVGAPSWSCEAETHRRSRRE